MNDNKLENLYRPEQIIKTIPIQEYKQKYVNTEKTLKACMECLNYSKNWACHEFTNNSYSLWDKYKTIDLYLTKINYTQKAQQNKYNMEQLKNIVDNTLFEEKQKLIKTLEEKEEEKQGYYLSAGYCNNCKNALEKKIKHA